MGYGSGQGEDQRAVRIASVRSTDQSKEMVNGTHRSELGAVVERRLRREAQLRRETTTNGRSAGRGSVKRRGRQLGRGHVGVRDERRCVRYRARTATLIHDQEEDKDEYKCGCYDNEVECEVGYRITRTDTDSDAYTSTIGETAVAVTEGPSTSVI